MAHPRGKDSYGLLFGLWNRPEAQRKLNVKRL